MKDGVKMADRIVEALKQFCIGQGISEKELENITTQKDIEKFMISRNLLFDCT